MEPIENHMVSLPQPELDEEVKCDHSDIHHISVECYGDGTTISFAVECCICGAIGTRTYDINYYTTEFED
jgi:hypothetical protein